MTKLIQIRNVPPGAHKRLKAKAAMAGLTLSDYLLGELLRIAELPSTEELRDRLHSRTKISSPEDSLDAVRAERDAR